MARKRWLAKILTFALLEVGALVGVPMCPEQIEDVARLMSGTKVVKIVRGEESGDGDPPGGEAGGRVPGIPGGAGSNRNTRSS